MKLIITFPLERYDILTAANLAESIRGSPATQWMVEPPPCFQSGLMNASSSRGRGSLSAKT